jgi:hypothetical protein
MRCLLASSCFAFLRPSGRVTAADTIEALIEKLKIAVPERLAENGISIEPGRPIKIETQIA